MSTIKKYFILSTSNGCVSNLLENSLISSCFDPKKAERTFNQNNADIIIVNTCGYNQAMENKSIRTINKLKQKFPEQKIIATGCLTKINPERINKTCNVPTTGPGEFEKFKSLIPDELKNKNKYPATINLIDQNDIEKQSTSYSFFPILAKIYFLIEKKTKKLPLIHNIFLSFTHMSGNYAITVSQGCVGNCTYCAIKNAKGALKSKTPDIICNEFKSGIKNNYKIFWLVGDDVGCWGQDIETDIVSLMEQLLSINGDYGIVINYFEPLWLIKHFSRLKVLFSDKRIININFPLQSASSSVLKKMGRKYDPKTFFKILKEIKKLNPSLVLKTHLMTGFPGETNSDFKKNIKALEYFDLIFVNKYTKRPHTIAAKYDDQTPELIKLIRTLRLNVHILFRYLKIFAEALYKTVKHQ